MKTLISPFRLRLIGVGVVVLGLFLIGVLVAIIVRSTAIMPWGMFGSSTVPNGGTVSPMMGYAVSDSVQSPSIAKRLMMPPIPITPGATADDRERLGPKIIRTGSLTLRVQKSEETMERIKTIVATKNGFIASSNLSNDQDVKSAVMTLRIPSAAYDATVSELKQLAITVLEESSNAEDVTAQYVDLDARLHAARAEETQYLDILKQARTVEDTLRVTEQLANVRTRIEQMTAEQRSLADRTDYSTLTVVLQETAKVQVPTPTWNLGEIWRGALKSLIVFLQAAVAVGLTAVIFLIGFLVPLLLILGLIIWLAYRGWRRWMSKR